MATGLLRTSSHRRSREEEEEPCFPPFSRERGSQSQPRHLLYSNFEEQQETKN